MMPSVWRRLRQAAPIVAPWFWFAVRDLSPALELVAVTLPLVAAGYGLANLAVFVGTARRHHAAAAASTAAFAFVAVFAPWLPQESPAPAGRGVTVVVANMLGHNTRADEVTASIIRQAPDIVVVPEASLAVHRRLSAVYPYVVRKDVRHPVLGVYGRYPMEAGQRPNLLDSTRQWRIEVDGPDERFVLWAVHLPKPWFVGAGGYQMRPFGHDAKLGAFLDAFDRETLPVVVAGDTNLTDRGRGYRRVLDRGFDDALRVIGGGVTARKWYLRPLFLRIDHVFVPDDWCAADGARFELPGSDHRGVRVRVGRC